MHAGLGSGQAGNCCGIVENVGAVDDAQTEVPDAFSEVRRSEVATEVVGGRAVSTGVVEVVSRGRAPLFSVSTPVLFSNLGLVCVVTFC